MSVDASLQLRSWSPVMKTSQWGLCSSDQTKPNKSRHLIPHQCLNSRISSVGQFVLCKNKSSNIICPNLAAWPTVHAHNNLRVFQEFSYVSSLMNGDWQTWLAIPDKSAFCSCQVMESSHLDHSVLIWAWGIQDNQSSNFMWMFQTSGCPSCHLIERDVIITAFPLKPKHFTPNH